MIDFLKILVTDHHAINQIRENSLLSDWHEKTNKTTGEITNEGSEFAGFEIKIIASKYLYLSGSLHKYWNFITKGKLQNYDDFSFLNVIRSINNLCIKLHLNPYSCKIDNIEYAVNVVLGIPADEVLKSVINHKGKPFTQEYALNKRFRECEHQRYIIKIYNKGLESKRIENILRFENRTVKMEHLKKIQILHLSDLIKVENIKVLGSLLQSDFNDLLFYDYTIQDNGLSSKERFILTQGQIPQYWYDLKKDNPVKYQNEKRKFRDLVKRKSGQDLQGILSNFISQKWDELLRYNFEDLQKLTDSFRQRFTEINQLSTGLNSVKRTFEKKEKKEEGEKIKRRFCLSCGNDISIQKPGSKICGEKYFGKAKYQECYNKFQRDAKAKLRGIEIESLENRSCQVCGKDISKQKLSSKRCGESMYSREEARECFNKSRRDARAIREIMVYTYANIAEHKKAHKYLDNLLNIKERNTFDDFIHNDGYLQQIATG